MRIQVYILSLFFFMHSTPDSYAQNLIENPSFEEYIICPDDIGQLNGYTKDWNTFFSSPDYLHIECGYYPSSFLSNIFPRTGNAAVSCRWFIDNGPSPEREYIQGKISSPLVAGELYYLEYYTHVMSYAIAINQHQAHFSTTLIDTIPVNGILDLAPHIQSQNGIQSAFTWIKTAGCYMATGGEQYVTLGNFASDVDTDTLFLIPEAERHHALIDDVSLYYIESLIPNDTTIIEGEQVILPNLVSQNYYYENELISTAFFTPPTAGNYEIEVVLEECGTIGSFIIEVLACETLLGQYEPLIIDSFYCIETDWAVNFPPITYYSYTLENFPFTDTLFSTTEIDTFEVITIIDVCGVVDTTIIVTEDCEKSPINNNTCFYIPNAFSPNFDGINDIFTIYGDCVVDEFEMNIFDRWGNHLFQSFNTANGWNGVSKNRHLNTGIYIYTISISYRDEENIHYRFTTFGDLMMIR